MNCIIPITHEYWGWGGGGKLLIKYQLYERVPQNHAYFHYSDYNYNNYNYTLSLAPLSRFCGSRVTTAHVHQCCIFQSYAKTVPSRMKLTMKLTMREPTFMGSMTTDHVITACDV